MPEINLTVFKSGLPDKKSLVIYNHKLIIIYDIPKELTLIFLKDTHLVPRLFPPKNYSTKKASKQRICTAFEALFNSAEREGFEPSVPVSQYDGLANRWFQPLTYLSRLK